MFSELPGAWLEKDASPPALRGTRGCREGGNPPLQPALGSCTPLAPWHCRQGTKVELLHHLPGRPILSQHSPPSHRLFKQHMELTARLLCPQRAAPLGCLSNSHSPAPRERSHPSLRHPENARCSIQPEKIPLPRTSPSLIK